MGVAFVGGATWETLVPVGVGFEGRTPVGVGVALVGVALVGAALSL